MSTLIFTIPFLIGRTIQSYRSHSTGVKNLLSITALIGGLAAMLFFGRRGFWLTVILSPLIALGIEKAVNKRVSLRRVWKPAVLFILGLCAVTLICDIDVRVVWDDFCAGFHFEDVNNVSAYRRKLQYEVLMRGWEANPLFGAGHGAEAAGNPYSSQLASEAYADQLWGYELSYIALLYHVGIVGVAIYAGAILWLFLRSIALMRTNPRARIVMLPLMTGLTAFLIANATNPYLAKFDFLWTIFLPLAFLNSYLVHKRPVTSSSSIGIRAHSSPLV